MRLIFAILLFIISFYSFAQQPIFEDEFAFNEVTNNLTYFPTKDNGLVIVSEIYKPGFKGGKYQYKFVRIDASGKILNSFNTGEESELTRCGIFEMRYNEETNEIFGTHSEDSYYISVAGSYPKSVTVFKLNSDWNKLQVVKNVPHPMIHCGAFIYKNKYTLLALDASAESATFANGIHNNGNYFAITFNDDFTKYEVEKLNFPIFKSDHGPRTNEFLGKYGNQLLFWSSYSLNSKNRVSNEVRYDITVYDLEKKGISVSTSVMPPFEKDQKITYTEFSRNGMTNNAYMTKGNWGNLYFEKLTNKFYIIGVFGKSMDENTGVFIIELTDKFELGKLKTFLAPKELASQKIFKGNGDIILDMQNVGSKLFLIGDLEIRATVDIKTSFCIELNPSSLELKFLDFNDDLKKSNAVISSIFPDKKSTFESILKGKNLVDFIASGNKNYMVQRSSKGKYQIYLMN